MAFTEEDQGRRRYILLLALLGICAAAFAVWTWMDEEPAPLLVVEEASPVGMLPQSAARPMEVYITGAVKRPGVYDVPPGSRVHEVVTAAGDVLPYADLEAVNLSAVVNDGEKIHIPLNPNRVTVTTEPVVNINTAGKAELITLPGIGDATAQKILDYRSKNGPFRDKKDIMNVSGIGEARYGRIKDRITL